MMELERNWNNDEERTYSNKLYNKVIKDLNLEDKPNSYLVFMRFLEEFKTFHKQDKQHDVDYEIKIIYNKY